jgi:hypothetical protein
MNQGTQWYSLRKNPEVENLVRLSLLNKNLSEVDAKVFEANREAKFVLFVYETRGKNEKLSEMNTSISKRPKQVFNLERFFLSQFLVLK